MTRQAGPKDATGDRQRIDRWLWCARFFRSRALAAQAVAGGKVHLNGERVKPAHALRPGDRLEITQGGELWTVQVRGLPARRGPAAEARDCYLETPDSELGRRVARARRRTERELAVAPPGRPDKRGRRAIRRLHGRSSP